MQGGVFQDKVIYKELSYQIIGILFNVYNELGYGHSEKYYYKAINKELLLQNIKFQSQVYFKLTYKEEVIGKYFLDYIIEDKIVLEMKKGDHFAKKNIEQIMSYLKATNLKLAILANFTSKGVKYYRLLNDKTKNL